MGTLHFGNGDCALGADLNTGLATKTFIHLYRLGLAVDQFQNLCGARIYTFLITSTLIFVNNNFKHDFSSKKMINKKRGKKPLSVLF